MVVEASKPLRGTRILVQVPWLGTVADDVWEDIKLKAGLQEYERDDSPPYAILRGQPLPEGDRGLSLHRDVMEV